jgi:hypothetical protein
MKHLPLLLLAATLGFAAEEGPPAPPPPPPPPPGPPPNAQDRKAANCPAYRPNLARTSRSVSTTPWRRPSRILR